MICGKFILLIAAYSNAYNVPAGVVDRVMYAESSCRVNARTTRDLGLMGIRRGITTRGYDSMTDKQLMQPRINIKLGIRRLARAKRICGGDPIYWLSNYAGLPCGPSKYSGNVLFGRNTFNSENAGYNYPELRR